jgi:hypothetical protein
MQKMDTSYRIPRAAVIFATILFVALIGGAFASYAASTGTGTGGWTFGGRECSKEFLTDEEAAQFPLSPNGTKACAIIKVCQNGRQVVSFNQVPNCPKNVTVWCMNGEGTWVNNTVGEVGTNADGSLLILDIGQTGHCGLFPAGSSLQGPVISGQ